MIFTYKTCLLVLGLLCTSIFIIATNHHGDLEFYLYNSVEFDRTGAMSIVVLPFFFVTENLNAICILWGAIFTGITIKLQRYISVIGCYLLILLGPFLLIPSKESLVFLLFLVFISLLLKGFKCHAILVLSILFFIRPFLAPIILALMTISESRKPIRLKYTFLLIAIIALFYLTFSTQAIEYMNGYLIGYYDKSLNAGTTDWEFIEYARDQTSAVMHFILITFRSLLPIWMLFLGGTGLLYFIWYVLIEFICIISIYLFIKNYHYKNLKINTIVLFFIAIAPLSILLVTNAGSAVRYISILPLILNTFVYNFKRKSGI